VLFIIPPGRLSVRVVRIASTVGAETAAPPEAEGPAAGDLRPGEYGINASKPHVLAT